MRNQIFKIVIIILLAQNGIYAQNMVQHDSIFMHCNMPDTWIEGKSMPFNWQTNAEHVVLQIKGERFLHIVDYSKSIYSDTLSANMQEYFGKGETIHWKMMAFNRKQSNNLFSSGITLQQNNGDIVCSGTISMVANPNQAYINVNVPSEWLQNDNISISWQTNCKYVILQLESERLTHFCLYMENENSVKLSSALWQYLEGEPLKYKLIGINSDDLGGRIKDLPGKSSDILSIIANKYDVVKTGIISLKN